MRLRFAAGALAATLVAIGTGFQGGPVRAAQSPRPSIARTADGRPSLAGVWQIVNAANWDLEAHAADDGIPGGLSVVEGGTIPYVPKALARRNENRAHRTTADPVGKCFLPGVPRVMYTPYPFEIIQVPKYILMNFEFAHARRIIYLDGSRHVEDLDFWMGDPRAHWENDTLVVDSTDFNDKTWFDNAGNYHSDKLHVVERLTPNGPDHLSYEATIEDPETFSRPWKISMPIYRRLEQNLQILEYDCVSFFWHRMTRSNQ